MEDKLIYDFNEYCIMLMDNPIFYILTLPINLIGILMLLVLAVISYPFYWLGSYLKGG